MLKEHILLAKKSKKMQKFQKIGFFWHFYVIFFIFINIFTSKTVQSAIPQRILPSRPGYQFA